MVKIFISYRRADSRKDAGRIYDRLVQAFGKDNVFKDVDDIRLGKDFRGVLKEAVAQCDVQLAIIGKQWLNIKNEDGSRRLDNPGDFVRIEIESALQRDSCVVIPVLVDGTSMPPAGQLPLDMRELAHKQAAIVRDDPDFHPDLTKIIRELTEMGDEAPVRSTRPKPKLKSSVFDVHTAIGDFYKAFGAKQWDQARQILSDIRASESVPRVFDIDGHENEVWDAIEAEECEKNYDLIRMTSQHASKQRAWEALKTFWQDCPDYDPDNLAAMLETNIETPTKPTSQSLMPAPFDWIEIPGGNGTLKTNERGVTLNIPTQTYWIAKYPVTNAQFAKFIDARGYENDNWWTDAGWRERQKHDWVEPRYWDDSKWNGAEQPVVGVSWYEAVAFCLWLSDTMDEQIMLPTEAQWQYAAQGDDGRDYPWKGKWDCKRCNNSVKPCKSNATTFVTQYESKGDSPFGVVDMAGNVWEWCLTDYDNNTNDVNSQANYRVLRGGAWNGDRIDLFRCDSRYRFNPHDENLNRGFRLALS